MNPEIPRRVFLSGIVGLLAGAPFAMRFFARREPTDEEFHRFSSDLQEYRESVLIPIREVQAESPFTLGLKPPVGDQWNYLLFSSSFLPADLSHAMDDEPDAFLVREGKILFDQTNKGQTIITGGDTVFRICSPTNTEERPGHRLTLLVQDGRLRPAKPKGEADMLPENQLQHLLPLESLPVQQDLRVGTRWSDDVGRLLPFNGVRTDYEVVGFSEVDDRKTAHIRFSGEIPNLAALPNATDLPPDKNVVVSIAHHGDAWFDLETGFLVRQELDTKTTMTGVKGYQAADGSESLSVTAKTVVQLFRT